MSFENIADGIEGNGKVIIITSLVMLLFVVLLATVVFFTSLKTADQVLVPNVQGEQFTEAALKLQAKELYPRIQLRFSDNPDDAGKILEQSPPAGTIVKAGRRITLIISRGAVIDRLENYVGKSLTDVQQHFASLFTAGRKQLVSIKEPVMYKNSSIPAGTILEQNPSPDTEISEGMEIEFIVSKGPESEKISVPKLEGMGLEEIYSAMQNSKLMFNIKAERIAGTEKPLITAQSIPADSEVEAFSSISISLALPENTEKMLFGIYSPNLPKYPYPVKVSLEAVYPDGKQEELLNFKHSGGKCDIPYAVQEGTVLVLTVLNKTVQTLEIKKEEN